MSKRRLVFQFQRVVPEGPVVEVSSTDRVAVIKIGRDQKSHLRVQDDAVSRMHAVIEARADEIGVLDICIIDLGSGTTVNGLAVNKADLKVGDEFALAGVAVKLVGARVEEVPEVAETVPPKAGPTSWPAPPFATTEPVTPPTSVPPAASRRDAVPPAATDDWVGTVSREVQETLEEAGQAALGALKASRGAIRGVVRRGVASLVRSAMKIEAEDRRNSR